MKNKNKIWVCPLILMGALLMLTNSCKKDKVLKIGDEYQGGIIFYLDGTNEHGMVCATSDQSTSITWYNGTYDTTNASGTSVGTGNANTIAIVTKLGNGNYAAKICYDLVLNDYSDWYLPSKDENYLMFQNLGSSEVGNFGVCHGYWSSSESIGYNPGAWYQTFNCAAANGSYLSNINDKERVRAVRAF